MHSAQNDPYLPKFAHDIFLSYRHVADPDPWIDALYAGLTKELKAYLDHIDIWRDQSALRAGDRWHDEIERALSNAAIFLAVVTETYLRSEVCVRELDLYFRRRLQPSEGEVNGIVISVLRHKFDQPPDDLAGFQGVKFFDRVTGRELNANHIEDPDSGFYLAVAELAQDLKRRLEEFAGIIHQGMTPVFLASMGYGNDDPRQALRRDLLQRDLRVLPDTPYLWSSPRLEQRIKSELDQALLCIHPVPRQADPERQAQVRMQLELATAMMKAKGRLPPLAWIPTLPVSGDAALADELVDFVRNQLANEGVEVFEGDSPEDFKTLVDEKLEEVRQRASAAQAAPTGKVALIVDPADIAASGVLTGLLCQRLDRDYLRLQAGTSTGTALTERASALAACPAAIVVWGRSSEAWVQEAIDAAPLAALRKRGALAVCLTEPDSDEKATFQARGVRKLPAGSAAFEAELAGFLRAADTAS